MSEALLIFWGSGSVPCWRPMIVMEEKGLKYDSKLISFSKKEHKGEELLKINPRGQVPTFRHGEIVLNESQGICHYLESQFNSQGTKLIPDGPQQQAAVLQKMFESQNIFDKGFKPIVYYFFTTKPEDIDQNYLAEKKREFAAELELWEGYLGKHKHLAGEEFSMADVYFAPQLCFMVRSNLSLDARPNLKRYYDMMIERPSLKATWPPHWNESKPSDFFAGV